MSATYKVWHCNYSWYGGYGAYQEYDCVVIAEIESKALGMALMKYEDTVPDCWTATEIPIDKELVRHINERCS
jgi:hypothetical protein